MNDFFTIKINICLHHDEATLRLWYNEGSSFAIKKKVVVMNVMPFGY